MKTFFFGNFKYVCVSYNSLNIGKIVVFEMKFYTNCYPNEGKNDRNVVYT